MVTPLDSSMTGSELQQRKKVQLRDAKFELLVASDALELLACHADHAVLKRLELCLIGHWSYEQFAVLALVHIDLLIAFLYSHYVRAIIKHIGGAVD